ncbi:MAG: tRNA preQ1(34) S-adenosylmethionine ribosyltransferase-isomerase QueA [Acidobacteria bacterium]|nr:tRNA preQ1(34) S-adenosylmethionine ribosyltransferase-isomerase QueA [Acidobacteriota bacterium]
MFISEFDYELPEELIAQHPLERRDASRMLVLNRTTQEFQDSRFAEFPSHVRAGDVVAVNNTRVFPARLHGRREPSGGRVELFLIREKERGVWETLARPARRLGAGAKISFGGGRMQAEVLEEQADGRRTVRFACAEGDSFEAALEEFGETPLPPYIKRDAEGEDEDRERYQTVYARERGAIAAPTAGLHFTPAVMNEIRARGARVVELTLHVGYGTFEPVRVEDLSQHKVAPEHYEISAEAARQLNEARQSGGRIIVIGTTTTRALESAADEEGRIKDGAGLAALTITPGYKFKAVDALLTNFHLPRSSLLALVAAFAGYDFTLAAYSHAVRARYRFYSYGDCMLII